MRRISRFFYCFWQILVLPILVFNTIMCAVLTMILVPFRNTAFVHWYQMWWCKLFFYWLFLPVTLTGSEHIDKHRSYVYVANHESIFDVFLIYGWLPSVFKWLIKSEARKIPFVGTACKAAGHIFVERGNARKSFASINAIKEQLHDGVCTVIFPEGTRSVDGTIGRFRRGAFQIAIDLNLPVVPLSIEGCYEVLPKGETFVHRHPVHLHIGEPIDLNILRERLKQEGHAEDHHDEAIMDYVRGKVESGKFKVK